MTYPSLEKRRQADEDWSSCCKKAADLQLECKSYDEFQVRMDLECFGPAAAYAKRCFKTYFWAVDRFSTSPVFSRRDVIDKMNMWYAKWGGFTLGCTIALLMLAGVDVLVHAAAILLGTACGMAMQHWRTKQFCQADDWIEEAETRARMCGCTSGKTA